MGAQEASWSSVAGVPLKYVRSGGFIDYTAKSTFAFRDKCINWCQDLQNFSNGLYGGSMTYIATGGVYVDKPGYHGLGRAFDLDIVRWPNTSCSPYGGDHASTDLARRRRYVAVEAVIHRHFRYVLNGFYNSAHGDHIHFDDGGGSLVLVKSSDSDVKYIQNMMNQLMGTSLAVDGVYGSNTDYWYREAKKRANVTGDTSSDPKAWSDLNWQIAYHGFRNVQLGYQPRG